jgi:hypothetical protein
LLDLARQPLWLAAIVLNVTGNVLQVTALHFGALALVQPLLVCNLLFAVLFAVAPGTAGRTVSSWLGSSAAQLAWPASPW